MLIVKVYRVFPSTCK